MGRNQLYGVDPSQGMIDVFKRKVEELKAKTKKDVPIRPLGIYLNSKADLPTDTPPFDIIYSGLAFHHIEDTVGTLQTLFQTLASGGYLFILDLEATDNVRHFHPTSAEVNYHGFIPTEFAKKMKDAGFVEVDVKRNATLPKDVGDEWLSETEKLEKAQNEKDQKEKKKWALSEPFHFIMAIGRKPPSHPTVYYRLLTISYQSRSSRFKLFVGSDSQDIRYTIKSRFGLPSDTVLLLIDREGCDRVIDDTLETGSYELSITR